MPKVHKKLTDRQVKEAKAKDKNYFLFDDGRLRLLIRPSGSKVWQYPYVLNKKNNICTIGKYGNGADKFSLSQARVKRDEIKELLKQGIDPNHNKKRQKQEKIADSEITFEKIAEEWYRKQDWTPKHAKNIQSRLEKDVFPVIGWKSIKEVSVQDMIQILKKIEERGAVTVAQRINGYCVEIFDYAISMSICEINVAVGRAKVLKNHTQHNRKFIKEKELYGFLQNLYEYDDFNLTTLSVKLLLLTLQRPGEVRNAKRSEIDFDKKIWHIPQERMKMKRDHLVPLPRQAVEILRVIQKISGNYEFLFPSKISTKKPMSDVSMIKMMKKFSDGGMTPHGVRHLGSTILNENGFNSDWVERQLSHVEGNKVRGVYNKAEYLEGRIEMMQWWADYLDGRRGDVV